MIKYFVTVVVPDTLIKFIYECQCISNKQIIMMGTVRKSCERMVAFIYLKTLLIAEASKHGRGDNLIIHSM